MFTKVGGLPCVQTLSEKKQENTAVKSHENSIGFVRDHSHFTSTGIRESLCN